jgi:hypothetical protein
MEKGNNMSAGQTKRANGRSIRYYQSRIESMTAHCKHCGVMVQEGDDDCLMCPDPHDTLPVSIQFAEAVRYQQEQINGETDEYWEATQ